MPTVFASLFGDNAASAKEMSTVTILSVTHVKYSPNLSFEHFMANFEGQCGLHDVKAYQNLLADPEKKSSAEKVIGAQAGPSGFMIFATYDHGALLNIKGAPQKAKQYVVGNPLIAARMTEHDIRAALYAPLRILVYEDTDSKLHVEYDLPSTLFGQFHNPQVDAVAKELDEKLASVLQAASNQSNK
jgi:uncharacterized protein (DUF302 family)